MRMKHQENQIMVTILKFIHKRISARNFFKNQFKHYQ
jgi:hypothetical protein